MTHNKVKQYINSKSLNKVISDVTEFLKEIKGIEAISLGGSLCKNYEDGRSDIDLNILFYGGKPINIAILKKKICAFGDYTNPLVMDFGQLGPLISGSSWFVYKGINIEIFYWDINSINSIIDRCKSGSINMNDLNIERILPYGFYSYYYLGIINNMMPLYDPIGVCRILKKKVKRYPTKLKKRIINLFLFDAYESLRHAEKASKRKNLHIVFGSIIRIMSDLLKVLYAFNEIYMIDEKHYEADLFLFKKLPTNFVKRYRLITSVMSGDSKLACAIVKTLIKDVTVLCKDDFVPQYYNFRLNG